MKRLGLTISESDNFRLRLGDNLDSLRKFIREYKIKYHAPINLCDDTLSSENIDNILILIMLKESGVEVKVEKGIITYIKAYNSELNQVTQLSEGDIEPIEMLNLVREKLASKIGIDKSDLRIKTFDLDKLFFTFETKFKGESNTIISVITNAKKELYIETIQFVV